MFDWIEKIDASPSLKNHFLSYDKWSTNTVFISENGIINIVL